MPIPSQLAPPFPHPSAPPPTLVSLPPLVVNSLQASATVLSISLMHTSSSYLHFASTGHRSDSRLVQQSHKQSISMALRKSEKGQTAPLKVLLPLSTLGGHSHTSIHAWTASKMLRVCIVAQPCCRAVVGATGTKLKLQQCSSKTRLPLQSHSPQSVRPEEELHQ